MDQIQHRIQELQGDLNAHRQGWVSWPAAVIQQKVKELIALQQK